MSCVLFYYNPSKFYITGSLFDAFEYFITIFEQNKEIKFYLINSNEFGKKYLVNIFNNRYDFKEIHIGWESNFIPLNNTTLFNTNLNKILLVDFTTCYFFKTMFISKPKLIINVIEKNEHQYLFSPKQNVKYYSEMVFTDILDSKTYNMKMRLDLLKVPVKQENKIFVNHPHVEKTPTTIEYITSVVGPNFILKTDEHTTNFFETFNKYVYIKSDKWFDPHPRLFHECYYMGKDVIYINKDDIKDGSWYRYYDMLENGFNHRILTKEDEIIKEFLV